MTGTDRGTERRRILAAVRTEDESDASSDDADPETSRSGRREPAPDGGTLTIDGPLFHCTNCDRTYLEEPVSCDSCGKATFDRRTAE